MVMVYLRYTRSLITVTSLHHKNIENLIMMDDQQLAKYKGKERKKKTKFANASSKNTKIKNRKCSRPSTKKR